MKIASVILSLYKNLIECFDRIDASEGIGVNKTSKSKEVDICHY